MSKSFYIVGLTFAAASILYKFLDIDSLTGHVAYPIVAALFVVGGGIIDAISELRASNVVNRVVVNDLNQDRR